MTDLDKREQDRVTINQEFESFEAFLEEYVTNISRSGVFIKSNAPLPVGTQVDLRFSVIADTVETIEGRGEVVRVEEKPTGMGVRFRELTRESETLLERILRSPGTTAQ